ncbi:MAG: M14 family metallocarboxypeptidase [Defluviitaleaceae bacterium]|nr:M14 family metallocarboxypeptidase [Defluviitaleaceae bacterium]
MDSLSYEKKIHDLAAKYPLLEVDIIGNSRMGKPIYALTLGYGPVSLLFNAAHHANEWITALILIKFAEDCAKENGSWLKQVTLHMVPMVNPDGVDIAIAGKTDWKANTIGVDLNSNYPAGWELAKAHKFARGYTTPGPRDYVGPYPLSEPESLAMAAFTTHVNPALTISLHTQGEEIYWRYRDFNPSGAAELALRLSQASGYLLEDVPDESSHAGYRDWFIQEFNRPGFTIECGLGESPLPLSDFDEIYQRVCPLLKEAIIFPIISMTVSY